MELSEDPELQPALSGLFLSMYLIILAVSLDSHLHTPMYFFLSNLSFANIGFISTTVPKMIVNIQTHSRVISYVGCLTQMSLLIIFGCMDDMLLTVMAYDRFVAICRPLYYSVIMNPQHCTLLVVLSFFINILDSLMQNLIALQLTCFKDVEIPNFFCHPPDLFNFSCSKTLSRNIVMHFIEAIFGFFPVSWILWSNYKIIFSILKMSSSGGRYKAFSTCGSHLSVLCLFYGTGIGAYINLSISHSPNKSLVASLMYIVVTPMLNPFIYSLRNRDISNTLKRLSNWKV